MGCISPEKAKSEEGQNTSKKEEERSGTKLIVQFSRGSIEVLETEASNILQELLKIVKDRLKLKKQPTSERIFKASDHKFQASAFHQHCHNAKNTILIAYSDSKRLFGGFTPCPWKKDETLAYEEDLKCSSFLFTVSDNKLELFELKGESQATAIMNDDDYGPIFGEGHDLIIKNECHLNFSWSNLGRSYTSKFMYGSSKSNQELAGKVKFLIRQYEIWQLHI